jgi:hypothetical protein
MSPDRTKRREASVLNQNLIKMYSLNCDYYTKEFSTVDELINDIMISGMDPNYEITFNGKVTSDIAADLIMY